MYRRVRSFLSIGMVREHAHVLLKSAAMPSIMCMTDQVVMHVLLSMPYVHTFSVVRRVE